MTILSVRNLDAEALRRLKNSAMEEGASVNSLVVRLIETATGVRPEAPANRVYHELDALAGTWSEDDAEAFARAVAVLDQPDQALWD